MTGLLAAGHLAAFTLLGITIYDDTARSGTSASTPDTPLTQPDPPPVPGGA
ncbi:hypothetical protein [Streptomyces sp. NPDC086766]|uniref:hypothetical protein n=1 Tax=Streptomyces sp. NPDC086766 TaxID=3365754 RepID=UPI0038247BC4